MQLLATAEQMQGFDRVAIKKFGIPGIILMENAGRACGDALMQRFGSVSGKRVLVACGKGNNGGDGFVIARHLANGNAHVHVMLLGKRRDVTGDARLNLNILLKIASSKSSGITFQEITSVGPLSKLASPDIVVDAIFGTGFSGEVRGLHRKVIEWINAGQHKVVSVDIPSGVDASNGGVANAAVKAGLTVTMALPKVGHYVGVGREYTGTLRVADIGIPRAAITAVPSEVWHVEKEDVGLALPRRSPRAHKYSVGKVFVIGGSRQFTGAPVMCAESVLRTGAGAVILGTPVSVQPVIARKVTEVMLAPLSETTDGSLSLASLERIVEKIDWADVVAIGPGLSRNAETAELVCRIVSICKKPLVIDADALPAIAGNLALLKKRKAPSILTPHVGELSRLIGEDSDTIELNRLARAQRWAKTLSSILVLKGAPTITGTPDGTAFVNSTGNPGMATVGAGDVLTGIIASLMAQGATTDAAAWAGVYVHGLAGDNVAARLGQRSLMAMDLVDAIPAALKSIEG